MHIIGKIDIEIYRCVTADIQTSDVIITQQQIEHIQERHPNDYERYFKYVNKNILSNFERIFFIGVIISLYILLRVFFNKMI